MSTQEKFGAGTLGASLRLGLAELRNAASFGGNVESPTPYGMYGMPTPGQVADLPSPSAVIDNPKAYLPEQSGNAHQQEHGKQVEHGREM